MTIAAVAAEQHERKFLLDGRQASALWPLVAARLRPQNEDPGRPFNFVRTTYFDTTTLAYYRSSGTPLSQRLRIREYASARAPDELATLTGACFLELKRSTNGLRSKLRVPLRPDEAPTHLARLPDAPLTPCVATWYQRCALADESGRLRVTLDRGLTFCEPVAIGEPPGCLRVLARGPAFVLELKLWDEPPAWLMEALADVSEVHGFSKFVVGMRAAEDAGLLALHPRRGARP